MQLLSACSHLLLALLLGHLLGFLTCPCFLVLSYLLILGVVTIYYRSRDGG